MTSQNLFNFDNQFNKIIIGTDEAGRGPAAGGVFASAVYFPEKSEKLIEDGVEKINGRIANLGDEVDPAKDSVSVNNRIVNTVKKYDYYISRNDSL